MASFLLGNLTLVTWNIPANADDAVKPKAPAGVYALDPHHASLQWSLPHNGISHYSARFDRLEAEITFDPVNLANCSVRATIDPTSVSAAFPVDFYKASFPKSGYASWSEDIAKNPVYLNANAFPTITFKSRSVALTGPRSADVKGDLTFLGLTKPVTLAVRFNGELEKHPFFQRPALGFSAEGKFKRADFGLAKVLTTSMVGDEVTIRFEGEFVQKEASAVRPK